MPIWGISVLAVGSIGAPLPSTGNADIKPDRAYSMSVGGDMPPAKPVKQPLNSGPAHLQVSNYSPSFQPLAVVPDRSNASVGRRMEMASDTIPDVDISASALPLKTISGTLISQLGQAKINDALIPPTANAVAGSMIPPMPAAYNRSIYGTAANNAYKVYFPQIEPPALGTAAEDIQSFKGAPDQDDRVLKKKGSYLFYEAQSDVEGAKKIEAGLKSDGNVDAETIARAVAKLGKGKAEEKLTAPPLQKKPLVFGESLFQASEPSEGNSETSAADQDIETIESAED